MTAAPLTQLRPGRDITAPTLTALPGQIYTTRWTAWAGASLIVRGRGMTLVDHGMTAEVTERLLAEVANADPRLDLRRMIWLRWDRGASERAPEHAAWVYPSQLPLAADEPLVGLDQVSVRRIGAHQALVRDAASGVLLAGDLLAPGVPELTALTPSAAASALAHIQHAPPTVAVGTHGHLLQGPDEIEHGVRARLAYLRVLQGIAAQAVADGLSPRQAAFNAWQDGRLHAWDVAPERHLLNIHAALAERRGTALDLARALADAREVAAARTTAV